MLLKPVQLGKLFSNNYIPEIDIYYCSVGNLDVSSGRAHQSIYTTDLVRFMPPNIVSGWGIPDELPAGVDAKRCRSNYMYWTWEETKLYNLKNRPIVTDTLLAVAHKKTNDDPHSLNALFADGHVSVTKINKDDKVLYDFITVGAWDERARDYYGFVEALKSLDP